MIEVNQISKHFESVAAINQLTFQIHSGSVFGLMGSNGAGKSTLLRLMAGVLRPDKGFITVNGQAIYENQHVKERIFFISDQPFFYHPYSVSETVDFYKACYPRFSLAVFDDFYHKFPVDPKRRLNQMSKGMQRQIMLMIALACQPDILLLDEVFDGLDPFVRQLLKRLLVEAVADRRATVVIASHNLRELDDICDHVGFLHKGGLILEHELDSLKLRISKVQASFPVIMSADDFSDLDVLKFSRRGALVEMVIRGVPDITVDRLKRFSPSFIEALPLTLEEVFIHEMEEAGYGVSELSE